MYESVGFHRLVIGDPRGLPVQTKLADWRAAVARDRLALQRLEEDIGLFIAQDRRYAAVFLPQIGHGPWPDIQDTSGRTPQARCRDLVRLQDTWLGEIVAVLKSAGRLERTLIVVVADHGVRTVTEDPAFRAGTLDSYTFHVPLLLYAPSILSGHVSLPWITSHIDVGPSLLDLLGIDSNRELEQGAPVWDERLQNRTTYIWGDDMFGVDGYHSSGMFFMRSEVRETVHCNSNLTFETRNAVDRNSDTFLAVNKKLDQMGELQATWNQAASSSATQTDR